MTEYVVEVIRDEVRATRAFPRDLLDIIVGYVLCTGDLLIYLPEAFPGCTSIEHEDEPPMTFPGISNNEFWYISIHIDPDTGLIWNYHYDDHSKTSLAGCDDPISDLVEKAEYLKHCREIYMFRNHVNLTAETCLRHLLRN